MVDVAKKCGVRLIIYTSFVNCQNNTNAVSTDHKFTEILLEKSGLNYCIARNAIYFEILEELVKYLMKKENNTFYNSIEEKRASLALIRELGEAGACILLKKDPKKIYELSRPVSYLEIIKAIEKVAGKEIKIVDFPLDDIDQKYNELGFTKLFGLTAKFIGMDFYKGIFDVKPTDFEEILGHPLIPLEDVIKELNEAPRYFEY